MQLFLLRHAEAEPDAANDEARTLTAKGSKQAESIGKFCREHCFVPEMILSSPLTRAKETARLVARELDSPKLVRIAEFLRAGMNAEQAFSGLREFLVDVRNGKNIRRRQHHVGGPRTGFQHLGGGVDRRPRRECSFSKGDVDEFNPSGAEKRSWYDRIPHAGQMLMNPEMSDDAGKFSAKPTLSFWPADRLVNS